MDPIDGGAKGPGAMEVLLEREQRRGLAQTEEALALRFEEEMTFEEMASVLAHDSLEPLHPLRSFRAEEIRFGPERRNMVFLKRQ